MESHWENVYTTKSEKDVSWYEDRPTLSLQLLTQESDGLITDAIAVGNRKTMPVIDVGSGASVLIDCLLQDGFQSITALDITEAALRKSQQRLQEQGIPENKVRWVVSDITKFQAEQDGLYATWHDRAVLHFLTKEEDRQAYVKVVNQALRVGGIVVIASFALDGPKKCSGLDTMSYDAERIIELFGTENYRLVQEETGIHHTPFHTDQKFAYFKLVRIK